MLLGHDTDLTALQQCAASMPFAVPESPKIYHITHVANLAGIIADGCLWSDRARLNRGVEAELVGMGRIKQRRLDRIEVSCHPGTMVGEYVPFYFCPRSVMLYILHMGNSADLEYRGGQQPIVHLQADLNATIDWAEAHGVRWACSDRNASAYVASFAGSRAELGMINWPAIASSDFRNPVVKEGKQAEFLLHTAFPWSLIEAVGVYDRQRLSLAQVALARAEHRPGLMIRPDWYY